MNEINEKPENKFLKESENVKPNTDLKTAESSERNTIHRPQCEKKNLSSTKQFSSLITTATCFWKSKFCH